MRRYRLLLISSFVISLAGAACSSDSDSGGNTTPDMGFDEPDAGFLPDATTTVPDVGTPDSGVLGCVYDRGGEEARGCEPGFVCNLAMNPPTCVEGTPCTDISDCRSCSDLQEPTECGHGYPLVAWCDSSHGNVCVRSKAPCEPCDIDEDCGPTHPITGSLPKECVDYGNGEKFCSRPSGLGCPDGFESNADSQCVRPAGCEEIPVICPTNEDPTPDCFGTGQICDGELCPDTGGARCSTNDQPGTLGICIGFCQADSDCPPSLPICNTRNGICINGCVAGTCPAGQVCHLTGFCAAPCDGNEFCETDSRYGEETYCNTSSPPQPPPRYFKTYHDPFSCQALGCERAVDCGGAGRVCDSTANPPACIDGGFTSEDCRGGEVCKDAPPPPLGQAYSREQCRAFPNVAEDNETLIGSCCNPGCLDRNFSCLLNEWCCGEPGSPYEDPSTCLSITSTGGRQAQPGECFEMVDATGPAGTAQWCAVCENAGVNGRSAASECSSDARGQVPGPDGTPGWYPGLVTDPNVNGGNPFRELEFCNTVAMGLAFCGTTCDPEADDKGCPRGQGCEQIFAPCCADTDCGSLSCAGADCGAMPAVVGRCQCGENGIPSANCPSTYNLVDREVTFPRCVEGGESGEMFCLIGNNCVPPQLQENPFTPSGFNFPQACIP